MSGAAAREIAVRKVLQAKSLVLYVACLCWAYLTLPSLPHMCFLTGVGVYNGACKKNFREIVEPVQRKEKWPLIFFPISTSWTKQSIMFPLAVEAWRTPPPPIHQIIWHLCHKKSCVSVFRLLIVWTVWDYTQRAYGYCKFNYLRCLILYIACMLHAITHVKKTRGGKKNQPPWHRIFFRGPSPHSVLRCNPAIDN
jgi:hypothetical protein